MSEKDIQSTIAIEAGKTGVRLHRNNVGVATFDNGRVVRYGLVNPGGSDLIGWTPVTITSSMIGKKLAVFTAVEVKVSGKKPTDEQWNFINVVDQSGGYAGYATSVEEAFTILRGHPWHKH